MAYTEREQNILNILNDTPSVDVKTLTRLLFASEATVRRDLRKLEEKGLIIRAHGKALNASVYADKNVGFDFREQLLSPVKKKIARAAVNFCVTDGNVVMLDASSTAMCAVEYLKDKKDVIVITSGLKTLMLLSQTDLKFYSTGGLAINKSSSFVGQTAINTVKSFNADVCLVSCHGLSRNGYVTDTSERENDLRNAIVKQCKRKVLLIDSSKLEQEFWHNLCNISEFDDVFCDTPLPDEILKTVKSFHIVSDA